MDFCNNFAVTERHNLSFSGILKSTISTMVFLRCCDGSAKENGSQRIELFSASTHGTIFRTALT
jgi:hypothetical protein